MKKKKRKLVERLSIYQIFDNYFRCDDKENLVKNCVKEIVKFYKDTFKADLFDENYLLIEHTIPYDLFFENGINAFIDDCFCEFQPLLDCLLTSLGTHIYNLRADGSIDFAVNLNEDILTKLIQCLYDAYELHYNKNVVSIDATKDIGNGLKQTYQEQFNLKVPFEDEENDEDYWDEDEQDEDEENEVDYDENYEREQDDEENDIQEESEEELEERLKSEKSREDAPVEDTKLDNESLMHFMKMLYKKLEKIEDTINRVETTLEKIS